MMPAPWKPPDSGLQWSLAASGRVFPQRDSPHLQEGTQGNLFGFTGQIERNPIAAEPVRVQECGGKSGGGRERGWRARRGICCPVPPAVPPSPVGGHLLSYLLPHPEG